MNKILKTEDFLEHLASKYDIKVIIEFLVKNEITSREFKYIGKCDGECEACGTNDFSIWREEELYYDKEKNIFIISDDGANYETLETVDFAIYICNKCGKWSTYIE